VITRLLGVIDLRFWHGAASAAGLFHDIDCLVQASDGGTY